MRSDATVPYLAAGVAGLLGGMALQAAQALGDQGVDMQAVLVPALANALIAGPVGGSSDAAMGCVHRFSCVTAFEVS